MATLEDLRFISCAYFYKLKDGISISNKDIENMLIESMSVRGFPAFQLVILLPVLEIMHFVTVKVLPASQSLIL